MNNKGLLSGNRAIVAESAYIQGISRISCLCPIAEIWAKSGALWGFSVHFSANFQQICYG